MICYFLHQYLQDPYHPWPPNLMYFFLIEGEKTQRIRKRRRRRCEKKKKATKSMEFYLSRPSTPKHSACSGCGRYTQCYFMKLNWYSFSQPPWFVDSSSASSGTLFSFSFLYISIFAHLELVQNSYKLSEALWVHFSIVTTLLCLENDTLLKLSPISHSNNLLPIYLNTSSSV